MLIGRLVLSFCVTPSREQRHNLMGLYAPATPMSGVLMSVGGLQPVTPAFALRSAMVILLMMGLSLAAAQPAGAVWKDPVGGCTLKQLQSPGATRCLDKNLTSGPNVGWYVFCGSDGGMYCCSDELKQCTETKYVRPPRIDVPPPAGIFEPPSGLTPQGPSRPGTPGTPSGRGTLY